MFSRFTQLIISISILIIIHELGHFILSILFKVKVEKFFLFFNPWFSIFKKKIGETIYGIGWIPLGGYIKISGMINEVGIPSKTKKSEFNSKSPIKKILIISGGIISNIILSIIIFSLLLFKYGESNLPIKNVPFGLEVDNLGHKIGLKNGDEILSVDHESSNYFNNITKLILLGDMMIINRNGKTINFLLNDKKKIFFNEKKLNFFLYPRIPPIIDSVIKKSNADKCKLYYNDEILTINYNPIMFRDQLKNIIYNNRGKNITIGINRNGNFIKKKILVDSKNLIGINLKNFLKLKKVFTLEKRNYSIINSFLQSFVKSWDILKNQILLFKNIFNIETKAYKQIGSFFSIAKEFPVYWNCYIFWNLTATLSIWLAFINLLPVPSLDGGYIIFIILEMIIGKKYSEIILKRVTNIGFLIISLLMLVVIIWDIFKFFF
ncbi:RIP metalloprotease RseP [Blattabacterium cuenoti]|uniref:RIP metalloprotease RseP n=1 Tax=Blattabacterium cuenoti TaxID=1653831 RepID=UPI00163C66FB|nr:RIP metalloprotease RseP [Blattabacterium cuenoti]